MQAVANAMLYDADLLMIDRADALEQPGGLPIVVAEERYH
jgi:hypothetical protein